MSAVVRTLPHSVDAEQAVLGALMVDARKIAEISDWLSPEDFYLAQHQGIYREILSLANAGQAVDVVTVAERLDGREDTGYILSLGSGSFSTANVTSYAEIVLEKSRLRQAIDVGTTLANGAFDAQGRSSSDVVAMAQHALSTLQTTAQRGGLQPIKGAMKAWSRTLMERFERGETMTGLPTPWLEVNGLTFGLQPSDLIVIGGRPGMGKSVLGFNLASFTALRGHRVAMFSLEMSQVQVAQRCVAALGGISNKWLRSPASNPTADYWDKVTPAVQSLADAPLLLDAQPSLTIEQICARARRAHMQAPLSLLVVDHIHIVRTRGDNPVRELGDISRGLKALAKELNIPVVALAQLNRANTQRTNRRPTMADLRQSGEIEQDADFIFLPHREDYYRDNPDEHDHALELIVGKGRDAVPDKQIFLRTRFDIMRLDDWEGAIPQPMPVRSRSNGRDRAAGFDA